MHPSITKTFSPLLYDAIYKWPIGRHFVRRNSLQGEGYAQLKERAMPKIWGNTPLLLTVILVRVLLFLPTIPPLGAGMPPIISGSGKQQ